MRRFSLAKGFSAIEFLLTAIPVTLLGLGAYETSRWYNTRHMISLALMEAARQGAVRHAQPRSIELAFEAALTPLFVPSGAYASPQQRMQAYFKQIERNTDDSPWRITILNPSVASFRDFHRRDLAIAEQSGWLAIDNNYQKEQHERRGIGVYSQQDIYSANTLELSLSYPYKPLVPGMGWLMSLLAFTQSGAYEAKLMREAGVLVIKHSMAISMQSHPVKWPDLPNRKVIRVDGGQNAFDIISVQDTANRPECRGIWCDTSLAVPSPPHHGGNASGAGSSGHDSPTWSNSSHSESSNINSAHHEITHEGAPSVSEHQGSTADSQEDLCGVSICCN